MKKKIVYCKDGTWHRIDSTKTSLAEFRRFLDYLSLIGVAYKGNSTEINKGYVISNKWYKEHIYIGDWFVAKETIQYIEEYNKIFNNEN